MPHSIPVSLSKRERALGCLLGGALGDAWGGAREAATASGPFEIPPHPSISDDTQFTLATCESILESGRIEPQNVAAHLLRWYQAGRIRGIGSSTLKAMKDLAIGTHWALAGARGEYAAGNGAAMRIAPLAFLLDPSSPSDRVTIRDVCRITHHNDEAYVGALAIVCAIRSVLLGSWSAEYCFLDSAVEAAPDSAVRDRIQELARLSCPIAEVAGRYGASGHVVDTVPLALFAAQFIVVQPLSEILGNVISAGGDTDTIASITGQLAGAVTGAAGILSGQFADLRDATQILETVEAFAEFASGR
ncbi:MAG: ADP-ribosylglycohydrolase family protein [Paludibaculum sp.]